MNIINSPLVFLLRLILATGLLILISNPFIQSDDTIFGLGSVGVRRWLFLLLCLIALWGKGRVRVILLSTTAGFLLALLALPVVVLYLPEYTSDQSFTVSSNYNYLDFLRLTGLLAVGAAVLHLLHEFFKADKSPQLELKSQHTATPPSEWKTVREIQEQPEPPKPHFNFAGPQKKGVIRLFELLHRLREEQLCSMKQLLFFMLSVISFFTLWIMVPLKFVDTVEFQRERDLARVKGMEQPWTLDTMTTDKQINALHRLVQDRARLAVGMNWTPDEVTERLGIKSQYQIQHLMLDYSGTRDSLELADNEQAIGCFFYKGVHSDHALVIILATDVEREQIQALRVSHPFGKHRASSPQQWKELEKQRLLKDKSPHPTQ